MSVSLTPSNSLGFQRPLTQLVKRSLTISNPNGQPIAFKVKTTAPKLYCVRPNAGRIEPGEHIEVSVMLQAMKEEPAISAKCKDKFLIQSTVITTEKETMALNDIWAVSDSGEEAKVHQQKLKVVYLPADAEAFDERDEMLANNSSMIDNNDLQRYDTVRQVPNGHMDPIPEFQTDQGAAPAPAPPAETHPIPEPPMTPPADFSAAPEEQHLEEPLPSVVNVNVHPPPPSPPPVQIQPQVTQRDPDEELMAKYLVAKAEIESLRAQLAAIPPPETELRRRTRKLSDDGSTIIAGSEVGTLVDEGPTPQEGVPLQVVVIIALGVFVTTYLFF